MVSKAKSALFRDCDDCVPTKSEMARTAVKSRVGDGSAGATDIFVTAVQCVTGGTRGLMTRRRGLTVLALMAAAVYAAMWCGWALNWSWGVGPEASTLAVGRRIGVEHHAWVTFWNAWCTVFSPVLIRIVTMGFIVYAFVKRRV